MVRKEQPVLKIKRAEYFIVDYSALEEFVEKEYGQEFNFVIDTESSNDTCKSFSVQKEKIDQYNLEAIAQFRESGEGSYITQTLLTDLCNRDRIPEGNYLITVSW